VAISIIASTGGGVSAGQVSMNYGTVSAGDIAIVACAIPRTGITHAVLASTVTGTPAYTQIVPTINVTTISLSVWARSLGATETTCTASGSATAGDGNSAVVTVIRGCVFNNIQTASTQGSGTAPNTPLVTVGSTTSIVLSIFGAEVATTTPTISAIPGSYSSNFNAGISATRASRCGIASIIQSNLTTQDPGAFTISATSTWAGATVALFGSGAVYFPLPDQLREPIDPWEIVSY
jgi:hypothetical protein